MREKLIELLNNSFDKQYSKRGLLTAPHTADDLIANGVVIAENATTTDKDTNVPSKWIPVTERLPQEDGRYMCNVKSFAFPGSFYQTILKYDKYGFRDGHIYTDGVTHWMPLPPAPKGE